ncbi:MogA/MoaB family molybdenum cofactor biosynthesis protein [Corynebacterium uterequi]|uniref:Molybdopterin biosynthesis enzyme n=1 Tax=Corynebacterium uterequi TaxID=1072256 RepID=A0A0G3HG96_9CORY|nr:MogA/MoaB family molybdenum cofactor biosynthesis protein [Corynebacterium uterequi]AKK10132.1 molybdopterin biosynthesis enzyme [Corynebacterium uterequi]
MVHDHASDRTRPGRTGVVIVASTRAAHGVYEDTSGPLAVEFLRRKGFATPEPIVVADADIAAAVDEAFARDPRPSVILTSGGTGITEDDRTVEAVDAHLQRHLPGVVHAFWEVGRAHVPTAVLSRAVAGVAGHTFAMTLPGSRGGVKDGCAVLDELLVPIVDLLEGTYEH